MRTCPYCRARAVTEAVGTCDAPACVTSGNREHRIAAAVRTAVIAFVLGVAVGALLL